MIFHKQFRAEIFRENCSFLSSARFKKLAMEKKVAKKVQSKWLFHLLFNSSFCDINNSQGNAEKIFLLCSTKEAPASKKLLN
jgi:hypothetical protein